MFTDGESLNCGERNDLWKKLEEEKICHDSSHSPLIKIWCAAHISNLAYKDVSKSICEVRLVTSDVISVGSYFHVSGVRTHQLKEAASSSGITEPLHWPDFIKRYVLLNLVTSYLPSFQEITVAAYATGKGL